MDTWEVSARLEIGDTISRYVRYADSGRSDDVAGLFTADGVLTVGAEELQGRAAIAAYLEASKASLAASDPDRRIRHHVSSLRIDLTSSTAGTTVCYFLAITGSGPDHWGTYRDRLVDDDDRWRFAHRAVTVEGHGPGSWAAGAAT